MYKAQLEKLKIGLVQQISQHLLDVSVDADDISKQIVGDIVMQVRGYVWAEQESVRHQEIRYPKDWWQAAKGRWFPAWARSRWPVEDKVVVIDVRAIYPEFRPAVPKERVVLHIMRKEHEDAR